MEPALQAAEMAVPVLCFLKGGWDLFLLTNSSVCDSSADTIMVGYLCCEANYRWLHEATFISYSCYSSFMSSAASACIYFAFDAETKRNFSAIYVSTCPKGSEWRPDGVEEKGVA